MSNDNTNIQLQSLRKLMKGSHEQEIIEAEQNLLAYADVILEIAEEQTSSSVSQDPLTEG